MKELIPDIKVLKSNGYDTVTIRIQCPHCGIEVDRECQTKDLNGKSLEFKEGDFVSGQFNYLKCVAKCTSPICEEQSVDRWGKAIYLNVFLDEARISGEYEILSYKDMYA